MQTKIAVIFMVLVCVLFSACQSDNSENTEPALATVSPTLVPTQTDSQPILAEIKSTATAEPVPTEIPVVTEPTATATATITPLPIDIKPELSRGVNLAGDFEVEPRGQWGTPIEQHFFDLVAEAGFDHVRIPIRWSAHTGPAPSFLIDEAFFGEVDWLLDQAARVGLTAVIDTHHFEELDADPLGNRDQLLAIWRQIGVRYADRPATVVFELNNEPTGAFNDQPELWNQILADTLAVVRETNPDRLVIIGPVGFNHPNRLDELVLPADDHLMATVHVYDPIEFTVQGATWFDPPPATGQVWWPEWPTLGAAWQNGTWDSTLERTADGYNVAFQRQYAAFSATYLGVAAGVFDSLTVVADQAFEAVALCNVVDEVIIVDFKPAITRDDGWVEMQADVSSCGDIRAISVQLTSENLVSPTLARADLCIGFDQALSECEPIIVTEAELHQRLMRRSAEWAAANGVPLYLGEFGVYDHPGDPVDRPSREAWIRSMRQAAEDNGIYWAYFELSNEFGVYDHDREEWRQDILDALLFD